MDEWEARQRVVREAQGWIGTPYHPGARVRGPGGGVDCAQLPAAVYHGAGVIHAVPLTTYPRDWHMHRSEELYLAEVLRHAREVAQGDPLPGDFLLYKVGRCWAHGAIVIEWPRIVHAVSGIGVVMAHGLRDALGAAHPLAKMPRRHFTLWGGFDGDI